MISEKLLDETELMVCELTSQHAQMVEATEGMRRSADNVSTGMAELFGAEEGVGEHVVYHALERSLDGMVPALHMEAQCALHSALP